jgi:hypothetical protein
MYFDYRALTVSGCPFQARLYKDFLTARDITMRPYNPAINKDAVWAFPRSLATTNGISLIFFPPGTKMFQFPGLPSVRICTVTVLLKAVGYPIRTFPDHSSVASSPRLFVGSNVLLRHYMSRHPPCARIVPFS